MSQYRRPLEASPQTQLGELLALSSPLVRFRRKAPKKRGGKEKGEEGALVQ